MAKGHVATSHRAVLLLLTALLICFAPIGAPNTSWAAGEWVLVDANESSRVSCIAFDPQQPNIIYLGDSCHGLSKTSDDGNNWTGINNGISFTPSGSCSPICSLVVNPQNTNTLYAGWNDPSNPNAPMVGLWKTVDGGQNWSRMESGIGCRQILSLAIDPQNPTILYAGTSCGVFKSANGGGSWAAVNQGIAVNEMNALAVDPQNSQTVYAATSQAIYKSINSGSTWTTENNAVNFTQVRGLVVDPQNSAVLYVGSSQGVWKSSDSGKTWMEMNGGLTDRGVRTLAIDPQDSGYLYAWTSTGVYKVQLIGGSATGAQASISASTSSTQPIIAINCGGPHVTAKSGMVYQADSGSAGGQTYSTTAAISGTDDPKLYQTERFGNFSYKFRVANGNYTMVLKFAEIYESSANRRKFSVKVEGREVLSSLDLYAQVGKNKAYDVTIPVTVSDGQLNIDFISVQGNAKVNAILVMPSGSITQNATTTSSVSLGTPLVSTSGSQTSTSSAGGASGVVTSSFLSGASGAMTLSEGSNSVDPTDPGSWQQFLSCSFDSTVNCGPLSPIQTNYTSNFDYFGKSGKEPDRGLNTAGNKGSNLLSYLIPADPQNPLRQQFESFGQNGTLSLWVKPLFDPFTNGIPHIIFQMIRTDPQNNNAPDLQNRLLLLVRDKQLEFGSGCILNASTGVCPDQYQSISLKKLDENVHEDEIDGIAGHYAWIEKEWHHVAIVWSTERGMSLYVDGGLVARNTTYNKRFSELPDRFYLGSRFNGDYPFNGVIDDVRFFNKSLSDWHIQEIFKNDYYAQIAKGTIGLSKTGFGNRGANEVEAGTRGTITITYTVPPGEKIEAGGGVKILRKHGIGNWEWAGPQSVSPCYPGYTRAELSLSPVNRGNPQGILECFTQGLRLGSVKDCHYNLTSGTLLPGDSIRFIFGYSQSSCGEPLITAVDSTPYLYRAGFSAAEEVDNTQFTIAVNRGGNIGGLYYELDPSAHPKLKVVSSSVDKLAVIAPSNVELNVEGKGRLSFVVVAEDKYRNPVKGYTGTVSVYLEPGDANPIATHTFTTEENGHYRFVLDNLTFGSAGPYILKVQDETRTAYSNVIYASSDTTGLKLYWGDLHAHSKKSDGFIGIDDIYKFMRDVANLDFAATADHIANPGDVYNSVDFGNLPGRYRSSGGFGIDWQDIIQTANKYNKREDGKTFVTFPGYEYSQGQSGKVVPCLRRNVGLTKTEIERWRSEPPEVWPENRKRYQAYWSPGFPVWPDPNPPHPRWLSDSSENAGYWTCKNHPEIANISCPEFDGDWNVYFSGTTADFNETIDEVKAGRTFWTPNSFAELVSSAKSWNDRNLGQVMIIPHHGGRQANIDLITSVPNASTLVPAVEITSMHIMAPCSFEAWANQALKNGAKIGFLASSDDHYGTAGKVPGGFIGVWATGLSRQEIFDAIKARRIVAASRQDRPYIRTTLKIGDQVIGEMGEKDATIPISSSYRARLEIEVGSVGGVENVQIIQNEKVVAQLGSRTENFFKVVYPTDFPNGGVDFSVSSRIYVKVIQNPETHTGQTPKAEGVAWSSPIFINVTGVSAPVNSITRISPVTYVDGKPMVTVTLKLNPMPMKTLGGETAQYVVKMLGTDSPNTPYETLAAMTGSSTNPPNPGCSATVPTGGKIYCIDSLLGLDPNTGEISLDYIFNSTFTGDRYIWAVVHNDAIHSAKSLWAPYALHDHSAWSAPIHSGAVNLSTASAASSTITAAAGSNGSISPSGTIIVNQGDSRTFTITPASGYRVEDVKDNGIPKGSITSYPLTNITANHTITATFVQQAAPSTTQVVFAVNCGSPQPYTDSTGVTYEKDNSSYYSGGGTYSTTAAIGVTNDSTLYQTERWGRFSYTFPVVNGNYNVTLKFAELYETAAGRRVFSVKINGQEVITNLDLFAVAGGQYKADDRTFPVNVTTGKILIEFYFTRGNAKVNAILITKSQGTQPTQYTITAAAGGNGSISPSGTITVNQGESRTFTITPATGYRVEDVKDNGVSKGSIISYPLTNITANHTITATFVQQSAPPLATFTITATAGAGGTISPSGSVTVNSGGNQTFTIAPGAGYQIADVKVNSASQGARASYPFANVTANQSINATFMATSGGGTGEVVFALNCGSNQAYSGGGITYQADTNTSIVTGGQSYSVTASIAGTTDVPLYQSERFSMSAYRIPIPNGTYDVTLKFAELYCGTANCRVFSATIEGVAAVTNLDLFAQAGKYKAFDVTKTVTVTDGYLDIKFTATKSAAKINGMLVKKR